MNNVLTHKKVVARKEYTDDCRDHLDFGILQRVGGNWSVNHDTIKDLQLSNEDAEMIQRHCDKGFKILKGELHKYQTGTYDGEFYAVRMSIEISDFLTKNDLWYED